MKYKEILKQLALKENTSEKEIEQQMKAALKAAGLDCSPKAFIEATAKKVKRKTIYSTIV